MPFKNHYKTLGLPPNASAVDVKRRFRKLALQFHPDTNQGNALAEIQFREIQEAYETLADPDKRIVYHQEWKLRHPGVNTSTAYTTTPLFILAECKKLHQQVSGMDAFRMNKEQVYYQCSNILSAHNLAILQQAGEPDVNHKIIHELLHIASRLQYNQSATIVSLLKPLVGSNADMVREMETFLKQAKNKKEWERYYPLLVLLITIVISIIIYSASR
jgi:molecular chaperone DnaJ